MSFPHTNTRHVYRDDRSGLEVLKAYVLPPNKIKKSRFIKKIISILLFPFTKECNYWRSYMQNKEGHGPFLVIENSLLNW
jgi:hypothetical protein